MSTNRKYRAIHYPLIRVSARRLYLPVEARVVAFLLRQRHGASRRSIGLTIFNSGRS